MIDDTGGGAAAADEGEGSLENRFGDEDRDRIESGSRYRLGD